MVKKYILSHLSSTFFSIFIPLFTIASVIFLVKISSYTTIITLNSYEMFKLYLFSLPQLLFFTLPITFVVSVTMTLYKLSQDNELLVLFSLGKSPIDILKMILSSAILLSIILLFNYIYAMPYIKNISENFIQYKKAEAKFNISASEFGHNFGDWMLFIKESDGHRFKDIVLYNKELQNDIIIKADDAVLINDSGYLKLELNSGISYSKDKNELKAAMFQKAHINDKMKSDENRFTTINNYWNSDERSDYKTEKIISQTLISIFPLISLFLIFAMGIVHSRNQKRWIYLWIFISITIYYTIISTAQTMHNFNAIWIVSLLWLAIGYGFYRVLVGRRF